jgi:hypothetical protein
MPYHLEGGNRIMMIRAGGNRPPFDPSLFAEEIGPLAEPLGDCISGIEASDRRSAIATVVSVLVSHVRAIDAESSAHLKNRRSGGHDHEHRTH